MTQEAQATVVIITVVIITVVIITAAIIAVVTPVQTIPASELRHPRSV
jgi:hypothetical protein